MEGDDVIMKEELKPNSNQLQLLSGKGYRRSWGGVRAGPGSDNSLCGPQVGPAGTLQLSDPPSGPPQHPKKQTVVGEKKGENVTCQLDQ